MLLAALAGIEPSTEAGPFQIIRFVFAARRAHYNLLLFRGQNGFFAFAIGYRFGFFGFFGCHLLGPPLGFERSLEVTQGQGLLIQEHRLETSVVLDLLKLFLSLVIQFSILTLFQSFAKEEGTPFALL